jgi:activator of HSP90 ATPase
MSGGVFNAANTSLTSSASAVNHGILIYQSSAVTGGADVAASAQRVICYLDTGTGLPIQPGAGTVLVTWDTGTNKIFKIG